MDTKTQVEDLLKNYHGKKRKISILKFDIERFTGLKYDEVIEALMFPSAEGERVSNSTISDKTAKIALIYKEITDKQNDEILKELVRQYYFQKSELELLEHCVESLNSKLSEVVKDLFINQLSCRNLVVSIMYHWR